jgi:hypothetical protein
MNINVNSAIQALCENLKSAYGNRCLNYGEAVESLLDGQGGNYITVNGKSFCSVNDAYDVVVFFVRQNSSPSAQQGGGMKNTLYRNTAFKMAVNAKSTADEFAIATIINQTTGITYTATDYSGRNIATDMFGLDERQFQTAFFTIDFTAVEKITCQPC